jgi:hypothetical protein
MKTILKFVVIIIFTILITACSDVDQATASEPEAKSVTQLASRNGGSVIKQEYPDAQVEVLKTFMAIASSITNGAGLGADSEYMDQLISFHDYGAMFTEFNYDFNGNGFLTDGEGNEEHERMLFGEIVKPGGVKRFAAQPGTLKVAVYYGNVANLTFISDFVLDTHPLGEITVNNLITLLFIKTNGEWKMVHEHHSPLKVLPSTGEKPINVLSEFDPSSASAAQLEVYATFGAIGATIMANSGTGAENMDELISFHAYGPKFTEFNYDGITGYSFNSEENEANERAFFGNYTVEKFAYKENTLNITVYHRNVANVTFISDFEVTGIGTINNLITLLFVKTKGEWKMVHEHHSPENH